MSGAAFLAALDYHHWTVLNHVDVFLNPFDKSWQAYKARPIGA